MANIRFKKKKLDPVLEDLVKHKEFHLKILHETDSLFKIGSFKFTVHPSKYSIPPKIPLTNSMSLYVGQPDKCFIYYEENTKSPEVIHYSPVSCLVPYEILYGLRFSGPSQSFSLSIIQNDEGKLSEDEPLEFCVSVQIGKEVVKTEDLSESFKSKDSFFKVLLYFNKDVNINRYPFGQKVTWALHDAETLYDKIRCSRKQLTLTREKVPWMNLEPLPTDSLKVNLRPYQIRAVKWMLQRESHIDLFKINQSDIHPLYAKIRTLDDQSFHVNKYTGQVYLDGQPETKPSKPGGILADEMGLGKSIEVLALVLLNPRPSITSNYKIPSMDTSDAAEYVFECVCRSKEFEELDEDDEMETLQCCECGIWQHSSCFSFDTKKIPIDYLCPYCWLDPATPPYPSKATLIVTPSSISHQWIEEIEKHLDKDSLTWLFYEGVKGNNYIQPYTLASYDVVLTTYEIFRKEINYVNLRRHSKKEGERKLRHPKKFISAPSPLLAVEWWRVCFDEAQMVESQPSTVSQFASKIHRVNLWCVTGTPIQQSINDVFGLLKLLGEDPYEHEKWFNILLYEPYCNGYPEPLIDALLNCFWRTAKKDVLDEICIPGQNEVVHYLDFSAVEEYFYARQHEKCAQLTTLTLLKFPKKDLKLKDLDRHTLATVVAPLLQLRQACCHPQAVSTGRGLYLPLKKKTMTMEGLLSKLLKKCKLECEEHHRQLIAATNGLAGIYQILGDVKRSVDLYREVLQLEKEHSGVIKTDRVQIIHALLNLADVLERHIKTKPRNDDSNVHCDEMQTDDENSTEDFEENPYNIGRTLEDDKLRERAEELRSKYLSKHQELIKGAIDGLDISKNNISMVLSEIHTGDVNAWCFGVLTKVKQLKQDDTVVFKVKEFLNDKQVMDSKLDKTFNSITSLKYILTREIDKLEQSRLVLRDAINSLSPQPSLEEINKAIDCHLRPSGMSGKCKYCEVHELFNAYEANLYRFKKDTHSEEPMTSEDALMAEQRRGIWADSEVEMILKAILGVAKNLNCDAELIEDGAAHLKLLENYKKEFKLMRSVWMNIRDYVSAIDEVEMAKIRMRVRNPGEPVSDPPVPYILESSQVLTMSIQLQSDKMNALSSLKRKKGRLLYLQNLAKSQDADNQAVVNKECPICIKEMGTKWAVLLCGHVLCNDCVRVLVMMNNRNRTILPNVKCPVCRQNTTHKEICYVNTDSKCDLPDTIEVKGSYSTKIVGVVKCILLLLEEDPKPKILVFSSWPKVLSILVEALKANSVPHLRIAERKKFEKSVKLFKIDPEKNVLLLPIQSGANGLNLIEATHVILVEPLLNAGAEKQALGRVHRLGQTKETTFHRFIVKSTIEEKIYDVVKSSSSSSSYTKNDDKEMTLEELADLFSNPNWEPMDIQ